MSNDQEIRSQFGSVLNIETGDIEYQGHIGRIMLTGVPFMISDDTMIGRLLEVHYKDYIDCFWVCYNIGKLYFTPSVLKDPTYLGTCFEGVGNCSYYRIGNDLVCRNNKRVDFFLNCQKLLYVTNPDYTGDFYCGIVPYVPDYLPHYIDLEGIIHGRDPVFTVKNNITILYDQNICIFNSHGDVCVVNTPAPDMVYYRLCQLDITDINIYPGVCQIFAGNEVYILTNRGLDQDEQLNLVIRKVINTKSARSI